MAMTWSKQDEQDDSGSLMLTILIASELAAFGILLIGFLVMSVIEHEQFSLARLHLDTTLASVNTLILLASGWQAARALRNSITPAQQKRALLIAAALGGLFVALKFYEYSAEIRFAGDATFNAFFELYFMLTGFHLAHVAFIGLLLGLVAFRPERGNVVILTALWHVIDLVWVVMFPLIYLV